MRRKITEISKCQAREVMLLKKIAYHQPTKGCSVPEHQPLGSLLPPLFAEHSATGCGLSAQLVSSVLSLCQGSCPAPALLVVRWCEEKEERPWLCITTAQEQVAPPCVTLTVLTQTQNFLTSYCVINSMTTKTSTARKVFLNVLHYNKGSLPALQNAVLGSVYGKSDFSVLLDQFLSSLMMAEVRTLMFNSSGIVTSCTTSSSSIKSLPIFFSLVIKS